MVEMNFIRYFSIWIALAKNSFVRQLEFKVNFIGRATVEIVWILTQVLFFKAVFGQTTSLAGWTQSEMALFVAVLILVDGLLMLAFHDNQIQSGAMIRDGTLDVQLLRPISSLFLVNFRLVNVTSTVNVACGLFLLVKALMGLHLGLSALVTLLIYSLVGFVTIVSLGVFVVAIGFWTIQNANLVWLFYELYRLGFRPESLYTQWIRRLLLSVFPAAFFVSIPVQLALGKISGIWYLWPWVIAGLSMLVAATIWNKGIKKYEGALS